MRFWLMCCALLFMATQGYDWVHHQSWLVELELPWLWTLLGGAGLAVISNGFSQSLANRPPPQIAVPAPPTSQSAPVPIPQTPVQPAVPTSPKASSKRSSISFEISKK